MAGQPLLGVHGFGFEASAPKPDPFDVWRDNGGLSVRPFHWDSIPLKLSWVVGSWARGYWNRYRRAWCAAWQEGERLNHVLSVSPPRGVIAHSLGSRVVMSALSRPIRWSGPILLFNAAEHDWDCRWAAEVNPQIRFYNVYVPEDRVLRYLGVYFSSALGRHNCIGLKGLANPPGNWTDIRASITEQATFGRHWDTYRSRSNWEEWRRVLGI